MDSSRKIEIVIFYFSVLFALIVCRLLHIVTASNTKKQYHLVLPSQRGDILDRNRNILATNIPSVAAYIKPSEFLIERELSLKKITKIFPSIDINTLQQQLEQKKFIWLKRYLSPTQKRILMNAGIPGVYLLDIERRIYPDKNLFSHVIGGVNLDNIGIAGVEKFFNQELQQKNTHIKLSVDLRLQHIVRHELLEGVKKFSAKGGVGIIMASDTGQILAMVSLPDFDPNKITKTSKTFNQATFALFEPGSIAKIFNVAMGLESGAVTLETEFDISKPLRIGKFTIHDFKQRTGKYTVAEIFKFSSNIGSAKIAQEIGKERQQKFLKLFGLCDQISMELLECHKPMIPKVWHESTLLTLSYGHGIAISPMHVLCAINGILNYGQLVYPTLLIRDYIAGKQIVSKQTSKKIRALMREVVTGSSGKLANIGGYFVLGKTGTSEKAGKGGYKKRENVCFFVAQFANYVILVMLDNPQGLASTYGFRSANWNATLVAGNIIRRIGPILGVVPEKDI